MLLLLPSEKKPAPREPTWAGCHDFPDPSRSYYASESLPLASAPKCLPVTGIPTKRKPVQMLRAGSPGGLTAAVGLGSCTRRKKSYDLRKGEAHPQRARSFLGSLHRPSGSQGFQGIVFSQGKTPTFRSQNGEGKCVWFGL